MQSNFFIEQGQEIFFEILEPPFFAQVVKAPYALRIDDCSEARVLHQTAAFLDDPNAEPVPDLFQLRLRAGQERPVLEIGLVALGVGFQMLW